MTAKIEKPLDALDECFAQVVAGRDKVIAFYDVRYVFASYCEVLASIGAACIKNNVYSREDMGRLLGDMIGNALTRESKTTCQRTLGDDAIVGGKQ
jgi:hypothetical protein